MYYCECHENVKVVTFIFLQALLKVTNGHTAKIYSHRCNFPSSLFIFLETRSYNVDQAATDFQSAYFQSLLGLQAKYWNYRALHLISQKVKKSQSLKANLNVTTVSIKLNA